MSAMDMTRLESTTMLQKAETPPKGKGKSTKKSKHPPAVPTPNTTPNTKDVRWVYNLDIIP